MKKQMTIRIKVLLIAFFINALCTAVYTYFSCVNQEKIFLEGIDGKLRSTAYALPLILPKGFHDSITGRLSIDSASYVEFFKTNTRYALNAGIKYLYTFLKVDGNFYECASSGRADELENGPDNQFYTKYAQPPANLLLAWDTRTVRFEEYTDEFGRFRSIFVPMRTAMGKEYIVGADISLDSLQETIKKNIINSVLLGVGVFIIVLILSILFLGRILSPIAKLASQASLLTKNNFILKDECKVELDQIAGHSHDEVGQMAHAFREMAQKLMRYIDNLKKTTAAKERIESELRIAHDIQMSFLKKIFPPFPDRNEFDLCARLEPAKQVGGDLYDFFLLDDKHLLFYVGDVSDKGVPAALFMTVTMTLMKRASQQVGNNPAEILRQVNEELCQENENLMFVTLVACILDFTNNTINYSNAGHNPPVIIPTQSSPQWLELPRGPALGIMPGTQYSNMTIQLQPEDSILLYTDGVNEAMNTKGEEYTSEKLIEISGTFNGQEPAQMIDAVMDSVKQHALGAVQSDDITIMSLKLK